jgi:hypothetical protein
MARVETNESRNRHRGAIEYVSPIWETSPDRRSGYLYTCPRCGWKSRVMKWRLGAEHEADRHALVCEAGR